MLMFDPSRYGLTLTGEQPQGPYPPKGFLPVIEHQLGNGDSFGFYWPFGREHGEPLVIEMQHDGSFMQPAYSSASALQADPRAGDSDEWLAVPNLEVDPHSPAALYHQAEVHWKNGELDQCKTLLLQALEILPEFTLASDRLWQLSKRVGDLSGAATAAIRAITSHPAFGRPSLQLLHWLKNLPEHLAAEHQNDPLIQRRSRFTFKFGGTKENEDYRLLLECMREYLAFGHGLKAVLIHQTYGFWMAAETVSFQERAGFSLEQFQREQDDLFVRTLNHSRSFI